MFVGRFVAGGLDRTSPHQHRRLVGVKEEEEGEHEKEQYPEGYVWSWFGTDTPYYKDGGEWRDILCM